MATTAGLHDQPMPETTHEAERQAKSENIGHIELTAPGTESSEHHRNKYRSHRQLDELAPEARGRNQSELPKGYYYNWRFIGTFLAISLGVASGNGCFALAAPILGVINADIGPDPNISWVSIAYLVSLAVCLLLVGRLSDIFGRRWFFVLGSSLAVIASIVGATAQSVPVLIASFVLSGIAAGSQISFFWVVSELVPMSHRFLANSAIYFITIPFTGLGAKIAGSFVNDTSVGWRGCFYLLLAVNATGTLLWFFCYHPPKFQQLHTRRSRMQVIKDFDLFGMLLLTGSFLVFLIGLGWGGGIYPWVSAHVLATIIVGAFGIVAFVFYTLFVPLKDPFLPLHLFRNGQWDILQGIIAICTMTYFAFAVIWPSAVAVLYDHVSPSRAAWMNSIVGSAFLGGQIGGNYLAHWIPPRRLLQVFTVLMTIFVGAAAANLRNESLTETLLFIGAFAGGSADGVAITLSTVVIVDQDEIGAAGGIAGGTRSAGSALGSVIYNTILSNMLSQNLAKLVSKRAIAAGLPTASAPALISALQGLTDTSKVPGLSDSILTAARENFRQANSKSFSTVFYATIALNSIAMICAMFIKAVDPARAQYVGRALQPIIKKEPAIDPEKASSVELHIVSDT